MLRGAHFRSPFTRCGLRILALMAAASGCPLLYAQDASLAPPVPDQCPRVGEAGVRTGSILGAVTCQYEVTMGAAHRDAILGLAAWDHSLLGAFELGARLLHLAPDPLSPVTIGPAPARQHPNATLRLSAYGSSRVSLDSIAKALHMEQLERQGMNLRMASPFGSFRLTYREIFNNVRANSLGAGVGQASAAATYTTPRFGAGGLMNFSAAALMGNGSINQLLGSGFGSSVIGGNGPTLRKSTGPTVALKLTF